MLCTTHAHAATGSRQVGHRFLLLFFSTGHESSRTFTTWDQQAWDLHQLHPTMDLRPPSAPPGPWTWERGGSRTASFRGDSFLMNYVESFSQLGDSCPRWVSWCVGRGSDLEGKPSSLKRRIDNMHVVLCYCSCLPGLRCDFTKQCDSYCFASN